MSGAPRIVIGIPLYNKAGCLPEAIESLLAQTRRDFVLLLQDDGSKDGTAEVAARYAARDSRVLCRRNERRLGLVGNWRRVFEEARRLFPEAPYFAWASDHDVWHPRWLEYLARELDRDPELVLAYPHHAYIDERGDLFKLGARDGRLWRSDTAGMARRRPRFLKACREMFPGPQIYGLFRSDALAAIDSIKLLLIPDRLVLTELALHGQFKQVPDTLYLRRSSGESPVDRQRASLIGEGERAPWHFFLPWWASHAAYLGWSLCVRGRRPPGLGLPGALYYPAALLAVTIGLSARRLRRRWSPLRGALRRLRAGRPPPEACPTPPPTV